MMYNLRRRSAKIETRRVSGNLGRIRHQTGPPGVDHPKPSKPRLGTWGDERALDQVLEICPSPLSREQNVYYGGMGKFAHPAQVEALAREQKSQSTAEGCCVYCCKASSRPKLC